MKPGKTNTKKYYCFLFLFLSSADVQKLLYHVYIFVFWCANIRSMFKMTGTIMILKFKIVLFICTFYIHM